jgi:SOS-response transcriptional repressor LexA
MLSKRQRQIYELISAFQNANGYSPTYRELQNMLGLASVGTVQKHVQRIKASGLLESKRTWRGLNAKDERKSEPSCSVPVIGTLSKTSGIELFSKIQFYPLALMQNLYGFRIKDASFEKEGFCTNDLLIIDPQGSPKETDLLLISTSSGPNLCRLSEEASCRKEPNRVHGIIKLFMRFF